MSTHSHSLMRPHTHGIAQFGGTKDILVAPPSPSRLARTWLGLGLGLGIGIGVGVGVGVGVGAGLVRGWRGPCARRATGAPRIAPGVVDSGVGSGVDSGVGMGGR